MVVLPVGRRVKVYSGHRLFMLFRKCDKTVNIVRRLNNFLFNIVTIACLKAQKFLSSLSLVVLFRSLITVSVALDTY